MDNASASASSRASKDTRHAPDPSPKASARGSEPSPTIKSQDAVVDVKGNKRLHEIHSILLGDDEEDDGDDEDDEEDEDQIKRRFDSCSSFTEQDLLASFELLSTNSRKTGQLYVFSRIDNKFRIVPSTDDDFQTYLLDVGMMAKKFMYVHSHHLFFTSTLHRQISNATQSVEMIVATACTTASRLEPSDSFIDIELEGMTRDGPDFLKHLTKGSYPTYENSLLLKFTEEANEDWTLVALNGFNTPTFVQYLFQLSPFHSGRVQTRTPTLGVFASILKIDNGPKMCNIIKRAAVDRSLATNKFINPSSTDNIFIPLRCMTRTLTSEPGPAITAFDEVYNCPLRDRVSAPDWTTRPEVETIIPDFKDRTIIYRAAADFQESIRTDHLDKMTIPRRKTFPDNLDIIIKKEYLPSFFSAVCPSPLSKQHLLSFVSPLFRRFLKTNEPFHEKGEQAYFGGFQTTPAEEATEIYFEGDTREAYRAGGPFQYDATVLMGMQQSTPGESQGEDDVDDVDQFSSSVTQTKLKALYFLWGVFSHVPSSTADFLPLNYRLWFNLGECFRKVKSSARNSLAAKLESPVTRGERAAARAEARADSRRNSSSLTAIVGSPAPTIDYREREESTPAPRVPKPAPAPKRGGNKRLSTVVEEEGSPPHKKQASASSSASSSSSAIDTNPETFVKQNEYEATLSQPPHIDTLIDRSNIARLAADLLRSIDGPGASDVVQDHHMAVADGDAEMAAADDDSTVLGA